MRFKVTMMTWIIRRLSGKRIATTVGMSPQRKHALLKEAYIAINQIALRTPDDYELDRLNEISRRIHEEINR